MAENAIGSVMGRVVGAGAGVLAAGILSAQRVPVLAASKGVGHSARLSFRPSLVQPANFDTFDSHAY